MSEQSGEIIMSTRMLDANSLSEMSLQEKSRHQADELLARRNRPMSYEERVQYALDLVDMHLREENPDRINECLKLYAEDAVWEAPARGVRYVGRETIRANYLRLFASARTFASSRSSVSLHLTVCLTICGCASHLRAMASRIARSP
jgi:hypothetical protein